MCYTLLVHEWGLPDVTLRGAFSHGMSGHALQCLQCTGCTVQVCKPLHILSTLPKLMHPSGSAAVTSHTKCGFAGGGHKHFASGLKAAIGILNIGCPYISDDDHEYDIIKPYFSG